MATAEAQAPDQAAGRNGLVRWITEINPLIFVIIALYVVLVLLSDRFLALNNQLNITRQVSVYLIIAIGQTFVIASRGIDLSVGSVLGFTGCVMATMIVSGVPVPLAMLAGVAIGAGIGAVNGLVIAKLAISPLIATLGMLVTMRGLTYIFMGNDVVTRLPPEIVFLGQGFVFGIPMPALISLAMIVLAWWLFYHTRFGRYTTSIGSNEDACARFGIHVDRQKVAIYAFQGACVGVAAAVLIGRLNGASPQLGLNYELHIIAAVVLGGTALYGGSGTILGTVLGILTIGVVENGMVLIGADFHMQRVLIGILLVAAVAYQGYRRRKLGTAEN